MKNIYLLESVNESDLQELLKQLIALENQKSTEPINIYFNCRINYNNPMIFPIINVIESMTTPIVAHAIGSVVDGAFFVFISCQIRTGYKYSFYTYSKASIPEYDKKFYEDVLKGHTNLDLDNYNSEGYYFIDAVNSKIVTETLINPVYQEEIKGIEFTV